ncbi:MAG: S41 family peptidase [Ginsengibacter sp.]
MKTFRILLKILIIVSVSTGFSNLAIAQTPYQNDFEELWKTVNDNYAYLNQQNIDWKKVKTIYSPVADTVKTDNSFISFLETVLNELHNGHNSLSTNLPTSNRLVPSGMDVYVEKMNGKYFITDVRKGFGAEQCGLRTGMEILKFNNRSIDEQIVKFLPKYTNTYNQPMYQYAIDMLFAGTHDKPRKITTALNGIQKDYFPDNLKISGNKKLIECKILDNKIGYIKVSNSLYNFDLINEFDSVLDSFILLKGIILDLSETPSGGNTTVARAIMGRLIDTKLPYQTHEVDESVYDTKQIWTEYVIPRKKIYKGKVVLMVGHWTGSMGEGIAIGLDAMNRVTIVGTKMAGLLGAIDGFKLTNTKIGFQISTERLYHINGTPRENYKPDILTKDSEETWSQARRIMELN